MQLQTIEYNLDEKIKFENKTHEVKNLPTVTTNFFRINNIQVVYFRFKMNNFMRFVVLFFFA